MTDYVSVFGGSTVQPSDVSYLSLSLTEDTTFSWPWETQNTDAALPRILDVTPDAAGWAITLPAANKAPLGADVLVRNFTAYSFYVKDSSGGSVVTVTSGQSVYVYLSANATAAGTWQTLLFGTGSSSLSADAVASTSVVAIANTLNSALPITTVSANYTILSSDRATTFVWTGGSGTLSLTTATTLGNNFFFLVRNSGTGTLSLDPYLSETIDGSSTASLNPGESCIVTCSGTAFFTVGQGRSVTFSVSRLVKSVGGSSDVTLTSAEAANQLHEYTGTLTGNINVIVPAAAGIFYVFNNTSGAYTLTVKTPSGTGVAVTQGSRTILNCDATNVIQAISAASGTVTSVATSADFTGGPITTSGTLALSTTGVSAGSYQSGLTVSSVGRVTGIDEVSLACFLDWRY
jgi:hypothetical protein